jgi:hypothetical protein
MAALGEPNVVKFAFIVVSPHSSLLNLNTDLSQTCREMVIGTGRPHG